MNARGVAEFGQYRNAQGHFRYPVRRRGPANLRVVAGAGWDPAQRNWSFAMAGTGLLYRRAPYPASVPGCRRFVSQEAGEETLANPIASGGPAALAVRGEPGIRTDAGRGYRTRGREG